MYHKWKSYDVWFLRYGAWRTEFFVILDCFLSFYPPNNQKNQNFEKMEKKPWRHYHFTNMYHKLQSYDVWFLRYWAWRTERFVILDRFFFPFYPLTTQKIKILKNWKKPPGDIIILHKCSKNHDHMLSCSLDMTRNGFYFYFSFWAIFCPFTPLTTGRTNGPKKWHTEVGAPPKNWINSGNNKST